LEADGKRSEVIPAEGRRERLPRSSILRGRKNFVYIFRHGKRIEGSLLSCLTGALPDSHGIRTKIAFAVIIHSRVGSAVQRNKIKRWIREAYRRNIKSLTDLTVLADCPIAVLFKYRRHNADEKICYAAIERDVQSLLEKITQLKEYHKIC
jgi:ribonuclease P protein component